MKRPFFLKKGNQEMPGLVALVYTHQVANGSHALYEKLINFLIPRLKNVTKLIDVGCGPGHATEIIAKKLPDAEVLGVDISDVFIKIAQKKRAPLNNLQFELGDALNLPHANETFNAAVTFMSIKAWPDKQKGVKELARLVKSGGTIALFECDADCSKEAALNFCSMWRWNFGLPGRVRARLGRAWLFRKVIKNYGVRNKDLHSYLEEAGLIEIESFSFNDLPIAYAIGKKP